jgi:hypothetical protein
MAPVAMFRIECIIVFSFNTGCLVSNFRQIKAAILDDSGKAKRRG